MLRSINNKIDLIKLYVNKDQVSVNSNSSQRLFIVANEKTNLTYDGVYGFYGFFNRFITFNQIPYCKFKRLNRSENIGNWIEEIFIKASLLDERNRSLVDLMVTKYQTNQQKWKNKTYHFEIDRDSNIYFVGVDTFTYQYKDGICRIYIDNTINTFTTWDKISVNENTYETDLNYFLQKRK